jgi:hypothetical protein
MQTKDSPRAGLGLLVLVVAAAMLLCPFAVVADLNLGQGWVNPDFNTLTGSSYPVFHAGFLPTWVTPGSLAASLTAPMTNLFTGTATSWIYYINGQDKTGGLGFVYRFAVVNHPGDEGVVRAAFAQDPLWRPVRFLDAVPTEGDRVCCPPVLRPKAGWTGIRPRSRVRGRVLRL